MNQQSSPPLLVQQVVSQDECQQPSLQKKCGAESNHDVNKEEQVVENVCLETGQVLASFKSITEAAQSVLGGLFPAICALVKGTKTSHMGFGWRYAAVEAPASISTAAAVQQAPAVSSTMGAPVASTQQDDSTCTPMTKRSPKRIKVTLMLNGDTDDDFANLLLAEFLPEGLSSPMHGLHNDTDPLVFRRASVVLIVLGAFHVKDVFILLDHVQSGQCQLGILSTSKGSSRR
jgi:hypothetical protein